MNRRISILLCCLGILLAGLIIISFCTGEYSITFTDFFGYLRAKLSGNTYNENVEAVLLNLRLPRIIAAVVFGASLSVAGSVYQTVFSNSMVSPDLLGVSSSAACGAAIAIVLGFSRSLGLFSSFAFSVIAIVATSLMSKLLNRKDGLLIAGIIVGGISRSCLGLLKFLADPENGQLESIVYWELGSLSKVRWADLWPIASVAVGILVLLFLFRRRICCLTFGRNAELLGIHVPYERTFAIIFASLLVSLATAACGIISWIGLIVPVFTIDLTKNGSIVNNYLATALIGAGFLLLADTMARAISSSEIPISIMTGAGGLIVFIIAIIAERKDAAS